MRLYGTRKRIIRRFSIASKSPVAALLARLRLRISPAGAEAAEAADAAALDAGAGVGAGLAGAGCAAKAPPGSAHTSHTNVEAIRARLKIFTAASPWQHGGTPGAAP
ncbi:hypothetical protein PSAC2689_130141 [Paraburkholderia sacchari]